MVWEIITIIEQLTNTQTIPNNYSFIDFLINENSSELSFNKAIELVYKYAE